MATPLGVAIIGGGIFVKEQHIVSSSAHINDQKLTRPNPTARSPQMRQARPQGNLLSLPQIRAGLCFPPPQLPPGSRPVLGGRRRLGGLQHRTAT